MLFLSVFILPGSVEALVRWGGKIKYLLIAYFLRNICAKNYQNQFMYVWVIARQSSHIFWGTVQSVVTDRVAWSVGRSVVYHTSEPCKNGSANQDAIWIDGSGGPREPCVRLGSRSCMRRGNFKGTLRRRLSHDYFSFIAKYTSNWLMSHRSHPQIFTFKGAGPNFLAWHGEIWSMLW